jgi:predicted Zn-dependent protease
VKDDLNICEHCNLLHPLERLECSNCGQPLFIDSRGALSLWRLGDIEAGLLGYIVKGVSDALGVPTVIQPGFVHEKPSARPTWKGRSARVFLDQILARHKKGTAVTVGITEDNIVPSSRYNFVFGMGYLGQPAAVISLCPLRDDDPSTELLVQRAVSITVHELGHTAGLDHHGYDEGIECVMVGDEEEDSLDTIDEGSVEFCTDCLRKITKRFGGQR